MVAPVAVILGASDFDHDHLGALAHVAQRTPIRLFRIVVCAAHGDEEVLQQDSGWTVSRPDVSANRLP
jgi:hypothetical protein